MMVAMDPTDRSAPLSSEPATRAPWLAVAVVFTLLVGLAAVGVVLSRDDADTGSPPLRLALSGGAADAMEPAIYPPPAPPEYRLDTLLTDLGATAPVYRLTADRFSGSDVARLAVALGIDGAAMRDPTGWTATGGDLELRVETSTGPWIVSVHPSGGAGSAPGSPGAVDGSPPGDEPVEASLPAGVAPEALPGPDEAEEIARDLLGSLGVLEAAEWRVAVADSGVVSTMAACAEGVPDCVPGPTETVVTQRIVTFTRVVDGREATGLEWTVLVGDRGALEGVSGVLADLELVGEYPLRPTQDAYEVLVAGEIVGGGMMAASAEVTAPAPVVLSVTGVELAATIVPGVLDGAAATYLVPVYLFTTVPDGVEGVEPGRVPVLALDPSVVQAADPVGPGPPVEPMPSPGAVEPFPGGG